MCTKDMVYTKNHTSILVGLLLTKDQAYTGMYKESYSTSILVGLLLTKDQAYTGVYKRYSTSILVGLLLTKDQAYTDVYKRYGIYKESYQYLSWFVIN